MNIEDSTHAALDAAVRILVRDFSETAKVHTRRLMAQSGQNPGTGFRDGLRGLKEQVPGLIQRLIARHVELGFLDATAIAKRVVDAFDQCLREITGLANNLRGQDRAGARRDASIYGAEIRARVAADVMDQALLAVEQHRRQTRVVENPTNIQASSSHSRLHDDGQEAQTMSPSTPDPKKVFIIHGQNSLAVAAIEHFVKALGLEPLPFEGVAAGMGLEFVGNIVLEGLRQARGIIALFTPDEYAALVPEFRASTSDHSRWQARPNVIFEAGIAFGTARERSILVTLGPEVKLFSDAGGIHIVRLDNSMGGRGQFRRKLIGAGCAVDLITNTWTDPARSGDFEACLKPIQGLKPLDTFSRSEQRDIEPRIPAQERSLSPAAAKTWDSLREECVRMGHSESVTFSVESDAENRLYRELQRHGYVELCEGRTRLWRLTDLGADTIADAVPTASGVTDLKSKVLSVLREMATQDQLREAHGTFRELAEKLAVRWNSVYAAMLALKSEALVEVQIPGGYDADSSFEVRFPIT